MDRLNKYPFKNHIDNTNSTIHHKSERYPVITNNQQFQALKLERFSHENIIVPQVFPKDKGTLLESIADSLSARLPKEKVLQLAGGQECTEGKNHFPGRS